VDFTQVVVVVLVVSALQQVLRCLVVQQLRSQLAQVVLVQVDKVTMVAIQYLVQSHQLAVEAVQVTVEQVIQVAQAVAVVV
jgi:hypothetical protein